jgi:hypothetical protein
MLYQVYHCLFVGFPLIDGLIDSLVHILKTKNGAAVQWRTVVGQGYFVGTCIGVTVR